MASRSTADGASRLDQPMRHAGERVVAIDTLRGFVLLGSCVAEAYVPPLQKMPASPLRDAFLAPLSHSTWHGCTAVDLGFPAYIMLIAMSITLSFHRRRMQGEKRALLLRSLMIRSALLFAFATVYHGGLSVPVSEMRFTRIFHRLAIAIFLSGLAEMMLDVKGKIIALVAVLAGYWALMEFVPVPGYGPGDYSPTGNLNHYLDRTLLGAKTYFVLSTLGVAGTCLMGLLGGTLLWGRRSPQQRLLSFVGAGIVLLNVGWLLAPLCPINKHIWTPSFVIYSAGWFSLVFGGFFLLTDVWG